MDKPLPHFSGTSRWKRLNRRLSRQSAGALPGWLANWAYWNVKLYRLPGAPQLRAQLKYRKGSKKYGIDAPLIVFQMGKVGSSSVYSALGDLDLDVPVYHAHVLNNFDVYEEGVRRTRVVPGAELTALDEGRALRRIVDSERWRSWSLISLVRAPVPRAISAFFENVDAYVPDFWARWERHELDFSELNEVFRTKYFDYSPIYWFDQQVRDLFGIDVFATPFPHAQGYEIYEGDRARLLLIRLEDLNRCAGAAMSEFLGLDDFQLSHKNVGGNKAYGELYRQFLGQLELSPQYVKEMHSTQYAQHFYTPQELNASVAPWLNRAGGSGDE